MTDKGNISDHDLLIRVDVNISTIMDALEKGSKIMNDHEHRLQTMETGKGELVKKSECADAHKNIQRGYIVLLCLLLTAALGAIGALLAGK